MLICYSLECGHGYNYRRHVKLKEGKRWCKKCRGYQKVTDVRIVPPLSSFLTFREVREVKGAQ
jgi:hypothetical protein